MYLRNTFGTLIHEAFINETLNLISFVATRRQKYQCEDQFQRDIKMRLRKLYCLNLVLRGNGAGAGNRKLTSPLFLHY